MSANLIEKQAVSEVSNSQFHLSLQGVSKSFKSGQTELLALNNIDLEVKTGEFVCLVGPSGCGKSTILNLVAGLEKPESGKILVNNQAITRPGPDRLLLFQEPALFPWLDVLGNVEFGLKNLGLNKKEREERAYYYLNMVHLQKFARFRVHQLSGGMRQRVAIARALAIDPDILMMDEPFSALDAQTRDTLHQELQQIWATTGKTILFVTHNVREAVTLGTRVIVFTYRPGSIKREFSSAHLARPRHIEDEAAISLVREITAELKSEVELAIAAEYGNDLGIGGAE